MTMQVQEEQVSEVVQAWKDMANHVQVVSQHMIQVVGAQETTQRAALASAESVKIAAWSFVFILVVTGALVSLMVHTANVSEAKHREGQRIQNALIEKRLEDNRRLILELQCQRREP